MNMKIPLSVLKHQQGIVIEFRPDFAKKSCEPWKKNEPLALNIRLIRLKLQSQASTLQKFKATPRIFGVSNLHWLHPGLCY